jgi:DNA-binding NtrC family response regulator
MNRFDTLLTGKSPEFLAVTRSAQVVAATDVNVLLLGETGTGKQRMARAIHLGSPRAEGPFITVNCSALPESGAEALLFGRTRGSSTAADQEHQGSVAAADGGTLFLDEVAELPFPLQGKLLRFIETGEYLPVGQARLERVDVRILAATKKDLGRQVESGQFRADLYYRLNVVPLELPPLRNRPDDVALLLEQLSAELAQHHGLAAPCYSREALRLLRHQPWPGNVRELRNFAERMLVLLPGTSITPDNLPREMRQPQGAAAATGSGFNLPEDGIRLEDLEVDMIRQALAVTRGNRSRAARLLGLTRDTLLYRIKKYAL